MLNKHNNKTENIEKHFLLELFNFKIFCKEKKFLPTEITNKKLLVNTINPRVFSLSTKNKKLHESFKNSDFLVMDGQYFGLASLLLKFKKLPKISGTDLLYFYLDLANKKKYRVFFMGSSEKVLSKIKKRINESYKQICVESVSPPYKDNFSPEENKVILKRINEFKPNILFVGMTAPKQEIWAFEEKNNLECNLICPVGAAFDWFAGERKQPERIWVLLGLEWFIRTLRRPEILKRYPSYLIFFWYLFLNIIKLRKD